MKKNSFIEGTIFASLSFLIIKFLGAIYVIPFYAIVGELGGALYSYAYTVYSLIINICTIGIPHAISKIISEYNTLEMYEAKEQTYKIGNKIMIVLSTALFLLMFIFAKQAAYIFIGDIDSTGNSIEDVVLVIRSISFCLLIVPYLAVKRGYLQGQKFITVSTTGEVIEQVVRVAFILVGSYLAINVFHAKTSVGVAIAVFGAFIAGLAAYIYLDVKIHKNKKEFNMPSKNQKDGVTDKTILKKIVSFSIPLMIVSITTDLYNMTDLSLIIRGLGYLGYSGKVAETIGSIMATWASKICLIVNAITFGLTINIIPHMSANYVKKDYKAINNQFIKSIAMVIVIGLPMSIGISILAKEVYYIFYGYSEYGAIILRFLPFSVMLGNINMVVNTSLQSLDKFKTIYITTFAGLLTNALLDIPLMILCNKVGIYPYYGAIISTIIGSALALTISLKRLKKDMNFKYGDLLTILKKSILPLLSMSLVVIVLEYFISPFFTTRITSIITCIICALVGAIVYGLIAYKNNLLYDSLGKEYVDEILTKLRLKKKN